MDFAFTQEEERFREELREFLVQELPDWWVGMFAHDERIMPLTKQLCQKMAAKGWLTMSWPIQYGGRAASPWLQMVLREEMWGHGEPRGPQYMSLNYIGPMIMKFGTEAQKQRFLPPMSRGEVLWCQGFSEPDAGTDLVALRCRAEDRGDHFQVNGQKIWTSYANAPADWCLLLVRTDPASSRHAGISVLLVDMTTPGVTVRPIESMAGPNEVNEVFFDDVVVPRACLLGEQDQGWQSILYGLRFERSGIAWHARGAQMLDLLVEHCKRTELDGVRLADRPEVRAKLAELYLRIEAARLLCYRVASMLEHDEEPVTEVGVAFALGGRSWQLAAMAGLEILGPYGQLDRDDETAPMRGRMSMEWVESIVGTLGAGTQEAQKNLVARGLGLPKAG
ncbi:MAG TPA: acyl-CoA dehydrogenase family protein [Solirubrobacteraceae bacterium]|jgi:alkylation response protein AidB-like acyl-CoA dehydrogenase|nr:acyl-CoA dehydrogenase family protein [Solirubrobacteraceae bacterium]